MILLSSQSRRVGRQHGPRVEQALPNWSQIEVPFSTGAVDLRNYRATKAELAAYHRFWRPTNKKTLEYYANASHRKKEWRALTAEEVLAVVDYSAGPILEKPDRGCYPTNRALRVREQEELDRLELDIKVLASALSKLKGWVGTSYRFSDLAGESLRRYQPGEVITEPAFMSTSLIRGEGATNRTVWIVHSQGGGKYIQTIADREEEVLFPPGTMFEVLSRRTVRVNNPELWQSPCYELIEMAEVPETRSRRDRPRIAGARDDRYVPGKPRPRNPRAAALFKAWSEDPFDAKRFVAALGQLPPVAKRWPKPLGLPEGDTCREHHERVLEQYNKYFGRPPYLLALTLGLHDVGKPDNDADQHAATEPVFREAFKLLGVSPSVASRWFAVVNGDPIGWYIRGESLRKTVADLKTMAKVAGFGDSPQEFLSMMTKYYQSDAGAYTRDAGAPIEGLDRIFAMKPNKSFILDIDRDRLRFNSDLEPKFQELEEAFGM